MGMMKVNKKVIDGRTHIQISCTPISPETRALLREFKAEVTTLEKKWKAAVAARKKATAARTKAAGGTKKKPAAKASKKAEK
jgi:hypothetical protein